MRVISRLLISFCVLHLILCEGDQETQYQFVYVGDQENLDIYLCVRVIMRPSISVTLHISLCVSDIEKRKRREEKENRRERE